jgi:adenylate cyclase
MAIMSDNFFTKHVLKSRGFWISMIITALFGALVILNATSIFDIIEMKSNDIRFQLRGETKPSGNVAIALVDEHSIDAIGRWPWSRKIIAALINRLNEYGAKTIAFDVLFTEPEVSPELGILNQLTDVFIQQGLLNDSPGNQVFFEELMEARNESDSDMLMATVMNEKGNVILSMAFLDTLSESGKPLPGNVARAAYAKVEPAAAGDRTGYARKLNDYIAPLPVFAKEADSLGFVNSFPDPDGAFRRELMVIQYRSHYFASLGLKAAQLYLDIPDDDVTLYLNKKIAMGSKEIPLDKENFVRINFYGSNNVIPNYSIIDILTGELDPELFKDKAIIIGGAAAGIEDLLPNPFSPVFRGVEKQATIVENIIQDNFIHQPYHQKYIEIIFVEHNMLLNFSCPILQIVLIYVTISAYRYFSEEKDKKFLKATFQSYLSPELIDEMHANRAHPKLGGEVRNITAFFTDIQGFSTFSELLNAEQLVELLNEYLTAMTDILITDKGTLDKYEGDAIVAFFGAPMDLQDSALRACRVAVTMQNKLAELREKWRNEHKAPDEPERNMKNLPPDVWIPGDKWPIVVHEMKMRIGINAGEIVVGNMGSNMRMNYTMMGDEVNLAARLESAGKQYGVYALVSEYTLDMEIICEDNQKRKLSDLLEYRFIDNIAVVGKSEPVKIFELCAMQGDLTSQENELFRYFDDGVAHYLKMEWDDAIACFEKALPLERVPEGKTTPSEVYINRCKTFKEDPPAGPGEKWDGVFRMTEK